ncbi:phytanoyl-CoA dioxygenase family protein [Paenibacillus kobensis]|uniref:phytanoyl-CoA dioxygenase family protein n=1 Tax=Paenibacillus kobensis TaxID=59841 RepID=UPI000FD78FBC|nr:phytanoyl-CoA dioxygenase family protein [Paenibacillus kobensis]
MNIYTKENLETNGYMIAKGLFSKEQVDILKLEYELIWLRLIKEGKVSLEKENPIASLYPRLRDYHQESDTIKKQILSPRLVRTVEELIEEESLVVSTSYYFKGPGVQGLPDHQDNFAIGAAPGTTCSAWISLDSSYPANGGLYFYKGSHKLGLLPPIRRLDNIQESFSDYGQMSLLPDNYEKVYLSTEPGDVVIFSGDTVHGSLKNETAHTFRRALLVHFAGVGLERLILNFNNLIDRNGNRVRRRLNTTPKITENHGSIFAVTEGNYYGNNGWTRSKTKSNE